MRQWRWEPGIRIERTHRDHAARLRLGTYAFTKKGISRFDLRDPYHIAVALTWPQFLAVLLALYLLVNAVFATLFWLVPGSVANARPHSFADAFFFSIQTLSTVGYGDMYPATLYGHVTASTELVCGLGFTAIVTGLTFVRFSRPRARLVFAPNPVVVMQNGKPTLMVRIGNGDTGVLADVAATLSVMLSETTAEGKTFFLLRELQLERAHMPILFLLPWTLIHVLDEESPLHGCDVARAIEPGAQLFLKLEAYDATLATTVHAVRNYAPQDVRFGMRYSDTVTTAEDGTPVSDVSRIGALEPDVGDRPEDSWVEREAEE